MRAERTRVRGEIRVGEVSADHAARKLPLLVHANRPVHPVVHDDDHHRELVLHGCRELLPCHQEVAVAGEADHDGVGEDGLRGDRRRDAVAHRTARRSELRPVTVPAPEPMHPDREVAGAVRDDRVGDAFAQVRDAVTEVERAGHRVVSLPLLELRPRPGRPVAPARLDPQLAHGAGELLHARQDRKLGAVNPSELLGAGVNVDERLRRGRRLEERVARGRHLAEPRPDDEEQVGLAYTRGELRIDPDADVADVARRVVVERVLSAERRTRRQLVRLEELAHRL